MFNIPTPTSSLHSNSQQEEPWYQKPIRKGWAQWQAPGAVAPGSNYLEFAGRPSNPITQGDLDYYGDDAFDLNDAFAANTLERMKEDLEKRRGKTTSKEPDDLEDYQFTTVQDVSDVLTPVGGRAFIEDDKLP